MNFTDFMTDCSNKDGVDIIIMLLLGILILMMLNCVVKVKISILVVVALLGFIMIVDLLNCLLDVSCTSVQKLEK